MLTETREAVIEELERALGFSRESAELALESGFKCRYCDRYLLESIEAFDLWENDHIDPISRGGKDRTDNMVLSCRLCNKIKRHWKPPNFEDLDREGWIEAARAYVQDGRQHKEKYLEEVISVLEAHGALPGEPATR